MEITLVSNDDNNVLHLKGELDTPASIKIQDDIDKIAAIKDKNLVIDFSELTYIASAGLRHLLTLRKAYVANNLNIKLINVQSAVMTVFKVTNFDKIFDIVQ